MAPSAGASSSRRGGKWRFVQNSWRVAWVQSSDCRGVHSLDGNMLSRLKNDLALQALDGRWRSARVCCCLACSGRREKGCFDAIRNPFCGSTHPSFSDRRAAEAALDSWRHDEYAKHLVDHFQPGSQLYPCLQSGVLESRDLEPKLAGSDTCYPLNYLLTSLLHNGSVSK